MGLLHFAEDTEPSQVDDKMKWTDAPEDKKQQEPVSKSQAQKEKPKVNDKDDGLYSLSYDQVNDNADELIELRGEGRYFGVTDPETGATINALQSLGPLCDNCHRRGHIRLKCKTVVCHKCGVVGDHYETQCPTTIVCSRCGERGHLASACTSKTRKRQYCTTCDTFSHSDFHCPNIWRSYITHVPKDEEYVLPVMFCYNCGADTHFGDECQRERSSRVPNHNGSAFSGHNLPKHLRALYFDSFERGSSGGYRNGSNANGNSNSGSKFGNSGNRNGNNGNRSGDLASRMGSNSNQYELLLKRRNYESNTTSKKNYDSGKKSYAPSRSGYIAFNTNKKKPQLPQKPAQNSSQQSSQANRSGYLPNRKAQAKPNRSGVIKKKRNGNGYGNGNMQALY